MKGVSIRPVVLTQKGIKFNTLYIITRSAIFYRKAVALLVVLSAIVFVGGTLMSSFGGIAAIGVLGATVRFDEALQTVEKEHKRTTTERKAFHQFAREVTNIPTTTATATVTSTMAIASNTTSAGHSPLDKVRNVYQRTVMGVPHYDTEYGDNLQLSLAEEFNRDLQIAIVDGQQFSPLLKQAVIEESMTAIERRDLYLEFLKHERRSLEVIRERVTQIDGVLQGIPDDDLSDRSYGGLVDDYRIICREIRHCEYLVDERQQDMHTRNRKLMLSKGPFIYEHLYRTTRSNFPVLDELIDRLEILHNRQQAIVDELLKN